MRYSRADREKRPGRETSRETLGDCIGSGSALDPVRQLRSESRAVTPPTGPVLKLSKHVHEGTFGQGRVVEDHEFDGEDPVGQVLISEEADSDRQSTEAPVAGPLGTEAHLVPPSGPEIQLQDLARVLRVEGLAGVAQTLGESQ